MRATALASPRPSSPAPRAARDTPHFRRISARPAASSSGASPQAVASLAFIRVRHESCSQISAACVGSRELAVFAARCGPLRCLRQSTCGHTCRRPPVLRARRAVPAVSSPFLATMAAALHGPTIYFWVTHHASDNCTRRACSWGEPRVTPLVPCAARPPHPKDTNPHMWQQTLAARAAR